MKEVGVFKVEKRAETNSGANRRLRKAGYLPGNIFGKDIETIPVTIKADEFTKIYSRFGRNSIFKVDVSGDKVYTAIVKEIQNSPLGRGYLHIGFQEVSLTEEIRVDALIRVAGTESTEAQRLVVIRQMDTIPVRGLPQNIPDAIEIDVSDLKAGDVINVGNIKLPEGVTTDSDPEQTVISINETKMYGTDETDEAETADENGGAAEEAQA